MTPPVRTFVALAFACVVSAPQAFLHAQQPAAATCSLSWVGHEQEIEQYLASAKVGKIEQVPIGVTKPHRVLFEPGGLVARAAWKPLPPSYRTGFHESYKAELAAYALDQLLEMHMVPPVIERKIDGATGALVYWIENIKGWDAKKPPTGPEPKWSHQTMRMRLFDQLIANIDRNAGNLLYDDDWHLFLIDHSRAFTDRRDLKGTTAPTRVDRELDAILARREKMREEIADMVKKRSEAVVFF
jgi:hypothetical protein